MSIKLKENQLIAARLLSYGLTSKSIAKCLNVREETISRWKSKKYFRDIVAKNQDDFLDYIEEKHFQIFIQCLSIIQEALDSNELSLKDKTIVSSKYLGLSTEYIMRSINKKNIINKEDKEFKKKFL